MSLPKIPSSRAIVRFQDCDPYGHLYNARYLDYFMNAREDQLMNVYQFDIYGIGMTEGLGWVVAQNQIAYLQPALLMEKLEITSRLIEFSPKTITVEFEMFNEDRSQRKSLMWTRLVHFDLRSRKSATHRDAFMELFESVHAPVEARSFDDRVAQLRKTAPEKPIQ